MISGPILASLGKLSTLWTLNISNNRLIGSLSKNIGSLSNLHVRDISGNLLEGTSLEVYFANLTSLSELDGFDNSLALRVSPNWIPPFHLDSILLRSWDLGPQFPRWVKSQKGFSLLDLSNTGILYSIPSWFWSVSFNFSYMNLSHIQIYGKIPNILLLVG